MFMFFSVLNSRRSNVRRLAAVRLPLKPSLTVNS
jgi:hypothetical protein